MKKTFLPWQFKGFDDRALRLCKLTLSVAENHVSHCMLARVILVKTTSVRNNNSVVIIVFYSTKNSFKDKHPRSKWNSVLKDGQVAKTLHCAVCYMHLATCQVLCKDVICIIDININIFHIGSCFYRLVYQDFTVAVSFSFFTALLVNPGCLLTWFKNKISIVSNYIVFGYVDLDNPAKLALGHCRTSWLCTCS